MRRLRLTERQWRVYLAVWLVAVAAVTGIALGVIAPKLLLRPPPQTLVGDIVMVPPVQAPGFTLTDQTGATISLADLRGKVVALTFLDTQCVSLCPLQASALAIAQSDLGSAAPLSIVVVSVHPDADTPAAISAFAQAHGLKGQYYWLNGSPSQLARVWASYGITVQPTGGDVAHSSIIYLIDRHGFERVAFADVPQTSWVDGDVRLLEQS